MPLRILIVTATQTESDSLIKIPGMKITTEGFLFRDHEITLLVTGVGTVATSWALTKFISSQSKPDLAINAGIAGSYSGDFREGEVVVPVSDCFADAGITTDKGFLTLAEAGLEDPDRFPFKGGRLFADNRFVARAVEACRPVNAVTVNTATGYQNDIRMISDRYHPDIETMEGAAFFYVCLRENIPFLALRAVSNMVENRTRKKWNIPLALDSLTVCLKDILILLE
jgi:futalosine hydrolase